MKDPVFAGEKGTRRWRLVRRVYILTVVFYAMLGLVIVTQAYAQVFSSSSAAYPVPGQVGARPPAGADQKTVEQYYRYLDRQAFANEHETYGQDVITLLEFYGITGLTIISIYFFAFMWYSRSRRIDLYPVEVYNGYISERGGPIDPFNWVTWAIMLAYAVTYVAVNLVYGQLY